MPSFATASGDTPSSNIVTVLGLTNLPVGGVTVKFAEAPVTGCPPSSVMVAFIITSPNHE